METTEKINVRMTLAALTSECRTAVDLDAIVARYADLGTMMRTVCPGCSAGEFLYEWENVKLRLRRTARRTRYDEEV